MSPVRWLRAVAVIGATALLMASSCSWQLGTPIPEGVPPPPAIRCPRSTPTPRAGPPISCTNGRPNARPHWACRSPRSRPTPTPRASPRWRTPTAIWRGRRWPASVRWRATTAPTAARSSRRTATSRRRSAASASTAPTATWRSWTRRRRRHGRRPEYARAMGPMQFIPETWKLYGVDANNDGIISPDNFDDAALSAAGYLCWRGKDLATPSRLDGRAARLQPLRPVRAHGAGLGDGLRQRTPPLNTPRDGTRSRLNSVQATSDQDARRRQCPSSSRSEPARSSIPAVTRRSRSKWPCWTARSPAPRCRRARRPASTRRWSCATAVPATAARASRRRWRPCSTRSRPRSSG